MYGHNRNPGLAWLGEQRRLQPNRHLQQLTPGSIGSRAVGGPHARASIVGLGLGWVPALQRQVPAIAAPRWCPHPHPQLTHYDRKCSE